MESELGRRFWFRAELAECVARNETYKERIDTAPCLRIHGDTGDVSQFCAFGWEMFLSFVHLGARQVSTFTQVTQR